MIALDNLSQLFAEPTGRYSFLDVELSLLADDATDQAVDQRLAYARLRTAA